MAGRITLEEVERAAWSAGPRSAPGTCQLNNLYHSVQWTNVISLCSLQWRPEQDVKAAGLIYQVYSQYMKRSWEQCLIVLKSHEVTENISTIPTFDLCFLWSEKYSSSWPHGFRQKNAERHYIKYLQFCDVRQSSSENLVNISNTLGRFVIAADFKSEIGA